MTIEPLYMIFSCYISGPPNEHFYAKMKWHHFGTVLSLNINKLTFHEKTALIEVKSISGYEPK